ncbi:MAG TPA: hypothetical protein PKO36_12245 [Candidatus Hydrogenedentes bacterium]|nr:hypothetical protein [Candidatus Hydrogenedentota bacterium]HOV74262.1 hypothetical protein [Candidatus Hydrogenedentota bacterium]
MLRSLKATLGFRIESTDGSCGKVRDFHFDSDTGALKYVVVGLGFRYPWHNVLISADKIVHVEWRDMALCVNLTRTEIGHSPLISADPPIYKQIEEQMREYSAWVSHWTPLSGMPEPEPAPHRRPGSNRQSFKHLLGYQIDTLDGHAARLADLFVDDGTWRVRALAVEMGRQEQAIILTECIRSIVCERRVICLEIDRAGLVSAPVHNPFLADDDTLEERLKAHYARTLQHA